MARPISTGLEYFPLDVDVDQDDKIALIESDFGLIGFGIIIKLFMKIYSNGYFYEWGEKEQKLFTRRVNVDNNRLSDVVNAAIKWEVFDEETFSYQGVLTSKGIQKRYLEACVRRKEVSIDKSILLLTAAECKKYKNLIVVDNKPKSEVVNVDNNPKSAELTSTETPQSKVEESKVKERRVEESESNISAPANAHLFYQNNFGIESPTVMETINFWIDDLSEELVIEAMRRSAVDQKGFRYAEGIMKKWLNKNITTMKQVEAEDISFSNQKRGNGSYSKQPLKVEELPNWAQEGYESPEEELMSPESAFGLQYRLYKLQRDDKNRMRIASGFNEQYGEGVFEKFLQDKLIDEAAMQRNGVD